jgi:hypothetical protein
VKFPDPSDICPMSETERRAIQAHNREHAACLRRHLIGTGVIVPLSVRKAREGEPTPQAWLDVTTLRLDHWALEANKREAAGIRT